MLPPPPLTFFLGHHNFSLPLAPENSLVIVVSALIRQLSAETIIPKVWSLSAGTYSDLSAEFLMTLTFLC